MAMAFEPVRPNQIPALTWSPPTRLATILFVLASQLAATAASSIASGTSPTTHRTLSPSVALPHRAVVASCSPWGAGPPWAR